MKTLLLITLLVIPLSLANAKTNAFSEEKLMILAESFILATQMREQPQSSEKDIDALLSLYADAFKVDHAKAGLSFLGRAEIKQGMMDKLADKVYFLNKTIEDSIIVNNSISMKVITDAKVSPSWTDKVFEYKSAQLITLEFNESGLVTYHRIN